MWGPGRPGGDGSDQGINLQPEQLVRSSAGSSQRPRTRSGPHLDFTPVQCLTSLSASPTHCQSVTYQNVSQKNSWRKAKRFFCCHSNHKQNRWNLSVKATIWLLKLTTVLYFFSFLFERTCWAGLDLTASSFLGGGAKSQPNPAAEGNTRPAAARGHQNTVQYHSVQYRTTQAFSVFTSWVWTRQLHNRFYVFICLF